MKEGIDIVIVNYYSVKKLEVLLESIKTSELRDIEVSVIIVSNSNEIDLQELSRAENIKLIINNTNKGFGYACNEALSFCKYSYLLLLNPDTILKSTTLHDAYFFMKKNKDITVLGVQHLNAQNKVIASCSRFPRLQNFLNEMFGLNKISSRFKGSSLMTDWDHLQSRFVDQVMGAFMLIRKEFVDKFDLMDERYFMFFEDMDFCKKVWANSGKVYYNSAIQIEHEGMNSTENAGSIKLKYFIQSRLKYARKHLNIFSYAFLLFTTTFIEPFSRLLFTSLKGNKKGVAEILKAYQLFLQRNNS